MAVIQGVGTSSFGKQSDRSLEDLGHRAVEEALRDAGVRRVDAAYVGTVFAPPGTAQRILSRIGLHGIPVVTVENACASGTTAFHEANAAIDLGRYEHALALGVEHMTSQFRGPIHPEPLDVEGRTGLAMPAVYAMAARRYLAEHGVTLEQLAKVALKNLGNARWNERAQSRGSVTVEEVLSSPMIADPLTRLQCCSVSDGAAAAVLGPRARRPGDVRVLASALGSGGLWDHRSASVWGFRLMRDVATRAYEQAGVGPGDVDVFEVHDAFTIGEIVSTEALGLAPESEGARLLDAGHTALAGPQPVNPSGGLLARGHPLGATGLAQIAEIVWQLRGAAGGRQVARARVGLAETMGGGVAGIDGNGCVVAVLAA